MPKNILVDLNIIMDVLLERPGYRASQAILELQQTRSFNIFVSAHVVTTFAYLLENSKVPRPEIRQHLDWLLRTFSIVATNEKILGDSVMSHITDYEDAVIEQAAIACNATVIVTRNVKDFTHSAVPALTPESFVK